MQKVLIACDHCEREIKMSDENLIYEFRFNNGQRWRQVIEFCNDCRNFPLRELLQIVKDKALSK